MIAFIRSLVARSDLALFAYSMIVFVGVFWAAARITGLAEIARLGPIMGIIVFMSARRRLAGARRR